MPRVPGEEEEDDEDDDSPIMMMSFDIPPPSSQGVPTSPKPSPNLRLLSFFLKAAVMIVIVLLFCFFLSIASILSILIVHLRIPGRNRFSHRHRHLLIEDVFFDGGAGGVVSGLSPNDLQNLPSSNYGSVLQSVSTRDCAVCLEGFREGELFHILPRCNHVFHATCIEIWLHKASACPICRRPVVETDEHTHK